MRDINTILRNKVRIVRLKSHNSDIIFAIVILYRNCDFFSQNCGINTQLWVIKSNFEGGTDMVSWLPVYIAHFWLNNSQLHLIKSQLRDINSQFWEKVTIVRYKLAILRTRGGKSTKIFYSSKSTITLLKFYLSTSKSTSLKIYSSKSKKWLI